MECVHAHIFDVFIMLNINRLYGVLLVAAELKQEKLLDYFGFLKTFLGRGLFYIL